MVEDKDKEEDVKLGAVAIGRADVRLIERVDQRQADGENADGKCFFQPVSQAIPEAAHEHWNADRMIYRRKRPHQRQRQRELPRVLCRCDEQHRGAHAEEEHQHHLAPAPMIAKPSRRQRSQSEQDERADAVRHQVFPA